MKDLSKMTYLEKLEYLRELDPYYKETSTIFSFSEKRIEQEINNILFPKPIEEKKKVKKIKKQKTQPKTMKQLKNENELLLKRIEKQQEEISRLREKTKTLENKIKKIKGILNAEN